MCAFLNHHIQKYNLTVKYIKNLIKEVMPCVEGFFPLFKDRMSFVYITRTSSKTEKKPLKWEGEDGWFGFFLENKS